MMSSSGGGTGGGGGGGSSSSAMDAFVLINYYLRKGWYDHVQRLCEHLLEKKTNDPKVMFWRAFGIILERSFASAIRELDNLKKKKEVELACIHALIHAHNQCKNVDHDEIAQLELQLVMAEENAPDAGQLLCANFFWHIKETAKARKILEQLCGNRSVDTAIQNRATLLRGWLDLTVEPKTKREADYRENSLQFFESIQINQRDAELLLGLAKYHEMKKNYAKSLEYLDELLVKFSWFKHSVSEKALILLKMGSWDQCIDCVERALGEDPKDIEALRIQILYLLSREGKTKEACHSIGELFDALKQKEPSNADVFYDISRSIARISDKNVEILHCNLALIEHAINLCGDKGSLRAERGYQRCLLEDFAEAMDSYKEALKLDESNECALHGLIYCQIKMDQLEDASQQMEFLNVIQESIGASANFVFLQALLSWQKEKNRIKQVKLLQKAVQIHMDMLKETIQNGDVSTHELMCQLNPLFLVEIASEFLRNEASMVEGDANNANATSASASQAIMTKGTSIVEKLVAKSPGFIRAQFILAQAYFTMGRFDDSYHVANLILKMDPSHSQAHLLQARICLEREHFRAASGCLDQALSHDFGVRQTLSYQIIKARILESSGEIKEALKTLQAAMKMASVPVAADKGSSGGKKRSDKPSAVTGGASTAAASTSSEIILYDKASVYIQMAQVLSQLNEIQEATRIVREGLQVFKGTSQEVRVLVTSSELALKRGDHDVAIAMLSNVPQNSPAFTKAQMVKADIYLRYRKDKNLYVRCYQELVAMNPSAATHVNMAEAYLRIQMLDQAIESFRAAASLAPNDPSLAGRIGKVLISKHDFLKAVDYYESSLKQVPTNTSLRKDLAELYTKLGHYDQALRVIQQAPANYSEEIVDLQQAAELQLILPKVYEGMSNRELSVQALLKAYSIQKTILDRQKDEQPDVVAKQRRALAETSYQIACIYENVGDRENVVKYCNVALKSDETHEESILALAKTFNQAGDFDQCQQKCSTLLRLNPSHEQAASMLADIMLQKEDYENAIYHFQTLLESKPDNLTALSRFIVMLRRAGKLDQVPYFFKLAERVGPRVAHSPGLHFCKGLYNRFKNKVREAIEAFNLARRDPEWGHQALFQMIEIYLNPDNENLWDSTTSSDENSSNSSRDQTTENIRIANLLLDELPHDNSNQQHSFNVKVLEAYAILAVKSKNMVDKAIQMFLEILEQDPNHVPALLGLANAYMLSKQQPKARNQLKRIAKMPYDQSLSDEFEKSYLMLADIYVGRSKYDLAQELCKKVLAHNKSCGKAWDLLGLIMEKEQSYIDAAECYQEAWKCEGEASASIGFKLAFNYLKAKKYVATVDVCQKVLDMYPDYPRIRKEVLEKAYAGFRP